jgi:hypothetical protein
MKKLLSILQGMHGNYGYIVLQTSTAGSRG